MIESNESVAPISAASLPVRDIVAPLPDQQLTPPYELRNEMTWIDFSTTVNPLGTPDGMLQAMTNALQAGLASLEPDRDCYTLKTALSNTLGLPLNSFLVGSTPNDLIRAVAQTYQPCTVGIMVPSEVGYALAIGNAGHTIIDISSHDGYLTTVPVSDDDGRTTHYDAALLANPSYPSSRLLQKSTLVRCLEACSWVIVDERSIEMTLGGKSYVSLTSQYRNLIVVRSFSVSFALPGVPVSYLVAHPDTIAQIEGFYDNSCISTFAEILGANLLDNLSHLEKAREFLDSEIPWLQVMLNLIPGIEVFPAEGNFVLCSYTVHDGMTLGAKDVDELETKLKLSGFRIRKLNDIPGLENGKHFCVSVRTRKDNERLVEAMRRIIQSD